MAEAVLWSLKVNKSLSVRTMNSGRFFSMSLCGFPLRVMHRIQGFCGSTTGLMTICVFYRIRRAHVKSRVPELLAHVKSRGNWTERARKVPWIIPSVHSHLWKTRSPDGAIADCAIENLIGYAGAICQTLFAALCHTLNILDSIWSRRESEVRILSPDLSCHQDMPHFGMHRGTGC